MIPEGQHVLIGLSGGPDSVALTHALLELGHGPLTLAHLNHGLRDDALEDEEFCAGIARELDLPFFSKRVDVARLALEEHHSLEEAGRVARYRFLDELAQQTRCSRIAVGHTRNDQAETLLLRLLRGAGTTGLGAMHPISGKVLIRPLLGVERRDILDYLALKGARFREDPTNTNRSFLRNRIRHETLPHLEKSFNPSIVDTLARTAELLRDDEAWMDRAAEEAFARVSLTGAPGSFGLTLCRVELGRLHPALSRRVIRKAIQHVRGHLQGVAARHVEDVLDLTSAGKSGRRLCLPQLEVGRDFDRLWLCPRRSSVSAHSSEIAPDDFRSGGYNGYEYLLPVPGRVHVPEAGGAIRVEELERGELERAAGSTVVVGVPHDRAELIVRNPRRGDRFRPLGAPGAKSLSRYLMDRRVGRAIRNTVPLVASDSGDILWVAGHGVSESSRVGPGRRRLQLSWQQVALRAQVDK